MNLRRIWLFLRIAGRDFHGGRLGISEAWEIAGIYMALRRAKELYVATRFAALPRTSRKVAAGTAMTPLRRKGYKQCYILP